MRLSFLFAILLPILPIILSIQAVYAGRKWLSSGTAGLSGYSYNRSEDPGWYWLTIFCWIVLIAFYAFSAAILIYDLKMSGYKVKPVWDVIFWVLLVAQGIGLTFKTKSPSA